MLNKIIVAENLIPKTCGYCKWAENIGSKIYVHCQNITSHVVKNKRDKNCPLLSVEEHDKTLKQQLVQEIFEDIKYYIMHYSNGLYLAEIAIKEKYGIEVTE